MHEMIARSRYTTLFKSQNNITPHNNKFLIMFFYIQNNMIQIN
jgi:hypothetical protein